MLTALKGCTVKNGINVVSGSITLQDTYSTRNVSDLGYVLSSVNPATISASISGAYYVPVQLNLSPGTYIVFSHVHYVLEPTTVAYRFDHRISLNPVFWDGESNYNSQRFHFGSTNFNGNAHVHQSSTKFLSFTYSSSVFLHCAAYFGSGSMLIQANTTNLTAIKIS